MSYFSDLLLLRSGAASLGDIRCPTLDALYVAMFV